MPETDKTLPENSEQSLDRKLDHAIYETFPTSDPVSVTVTKGGAIDYDEDDTTQSDATGATEGLVGQARETLQGVAESAAGMARGAYEQGRRYARQAADRYPEAERYYRESRRVVREYVPENPMLTLLLGVAVGYGLAWMIHHEGW